MDIMVYPGPEKLNWRGSPILLYDKIGRTEKLLSQQGVPYKKITAKDLGSLPSDGFLLVGYNAADADLVSAEKSLSRFVSDGGRVLVMEQGMSRSCSRSVAFVRAPKHPVFRGLPTERLELWRSTSREISSSDILINTALRQTALLEVVDNPKDDVYSDYVPVLVESTAGKGRTILCNLNLTESFEQGDPEAVIMLSNLLDYAASPVEGKKTGCLLCR